MATILESGEMFYNSFQPKVKNGFIMSIGDIPTYMVKMVNRPSLKFDVITMDHINIKRKLQGKGEWNDIQLTLYDPIIPSGAQLVMEWIRLSHESITGRRGYADFYKKNLTLKLLGPVGDVVEQWSIIGAFINEAAFGDLDWSAGGDVVTVDLTLSMDYCVLEW